MNGIRELTTKRLLLRKPVQKDAELLHRELGCNPEITRYTGWNPYRTPEAAKEKVLQDIENNEKPGNYSWIIERDGEAVGTIGAYGYDPDIVSIEIGYSIFRNAWGYGYASEAAKRVVKFLIEEEEINRVHAWCHDGNQASAKVLEHAGLKQEGLLKQAMRNPDGTLADQRLYGVVKGEFIEAQQFDR
ncbi:MAG: GNAT family N-acetyltransferase [Eubacterium sp.]|nr:GNAT family N-acetyltransferase [Eubacterium sp.]